MEQQEQKLTAIAALLNEPIDDSEFKSSVIELLENVNVKPTEVTQKNNDDQINFTTNYIQEKVDILNKSLGDWNRAKIANNLVKLSEVKNEPALELPKAHIKLCNNSPFTPQTNAEIKLQKNLEDFFGSETIRDEFLELFKRRGFVIAGGFIAATLFGYKYKDLDVFITNDKYNPKSVFSEQSEVSKCVYESIVEFIMLYIKHYPRHIILHNYNCVRFVRPDGLVMELVTSVYSGPSAIINAFDLGCCMYYYDGEIMTNSEGAHCFKYGEILFNLKCWSPNSLQRALKYMNRGITMVLPGVSTLIIRGDSIRIFNAKFLKVHRNLDSNKYLYVSVSFTEKYYLTAPSYSDYHIITMLKDKIMVADDSIIEKYGLKIVWSRELLGNFDNGETRAKVNEMLTYGDAYFKKDSFVRNLFEYNTELEKSVNRLHSSDRMNISASDLVESLQELSKHNLEQYTRLTKKPE